MTAARRTELVGPSLTRNKSHCDYVRPFAHECGGRHQCGYYRGQGRLSRRLSRQRRTRDEFEDNQGGDRGLASDKRHSP